jgi:hypothetical protein
MKKSMLTVRDVDEETWRKFKAKTAEEGIKTGPALTEAIKEWVRGKNGKFRPDPKNILKLEGMIKVKKKVRWSEEIDEFLYGLEK